MAARDPSPWLRHAAARFGPDERVVDVACGAGRHARWLAARGCRVLAVDRDRQALAALAGTPGVDVLCADLEADGWPLTPEARFAAVVVTRYLWRPLLPALVGAVAPGGVLVYETFAAGHERFGRPRRAEFLLRPGELLAVAAAGGLDVVAYQHGVVAEPEPARVQRVVARRGAKHGR